MKRIFLTAFFVALLLVPAGRVFPGPADFGNVLSGYSVTSWGQKDGLPPGVIWAIAQDPAGYLWLGTDAGAFVFDGVRFVHWQSPAGGAALPDHAVRAVSISKDGSIWFGFDEPGGISRIRDGQVRNFGATDGLGPGAVTALFEDPQGHMWAGTRDELYQFSNGTWNASGSGLPSAVMYEIRVDGEGRFLVGTAVGLFVRAAGESTFHPLGTSPNPVRGIAEGPTGDVWVADSVTAVRKLHGAPVPIGEKGNGSRLLYDSNGNLWVGTFGQGLWRVQWPPSTAPVLEKTTTLTGLSDDGVSGLLEDRDGNIWVATYDGLNRLTPHHVTPVLNLGVIRGVEATPDGAVWIGSVDGLLEFQEGTVQPRRQPRDFGGAPPSAMHVDERGVLWVATSRDLLRFDNGRWSVVPLPGLQPLQLSSIMSDGIGGVWLYDRARGLWHWSDGLLEPADLLSDLRQIQIMCVFRDRAGLVWLSFADGRLAKLDPRGQVRVYSRSDGLGDDVYRVIYEDRAGVLWLGGNNGLSRLVGGRFQTLSPTNGAPIGAVISIVEADDDGLWVGLEGAGIVRIDRDELRQAFADGSYQMRSVFFDKFDGFAGAPRWFGSSSVAKGRDGRLWFLSARGVTIIDPRTLREWPGRVGDVRIDRVLADGRPMPPGSGSLSLSQTARLEIEYSVPSLTYPLRTHFRYRLEGLGPDWVDAGTQRQAVYTNLPPRRYRFRVVASNTDGTWPEGGAVWDFLVPPRFYQTAWFWGVCVLGVAASIGLAWRLRLRGLRKQFLILLGERARLSREIHDTLLQGLCGIGLQCDVIANDHTLSAAAIRTRLLRVRHEAEEYAREARRSILDLRSPRLQSRQLAEALRQAGERAIAGSEVRLNLAVSGVPFQNSALADEQLFRIGQEALINAIHHGEASTVDVDLRYEDTAVVLTVSDNGHGFDPADVRASQGHYGLLSMKERAEAAGGALTISSGVGHGTQIEATVPRHPSS